MGFFSDLQRSMREERGRALFKELADTQQRMANLPEASKTIAILGFVSLREPLAKQFFNMHADGRKKLQREYRQRAREVFDLNMAEGYAFWLVSAWLEALSLSGPAAEKVLEFLDSVAVEAGGKPISGFD